MNFANNIFRLLIDLNQRTNKDEIVNHFMKEMGKLFHPVRFSLATSDEKSWKTAKKPAKNSAFFLELKTKKYQFGKIEVQSSNPLEEDSYTLINNATQMVSLILEEITIDEKIEEEKRSLERIAEERQNRLQQTIDELQKTKNTSLNLIEDLTIEIEKRKHTEKILEESEERYRLLLDNSLDAILMTSPDGSVLSANQAACDLFQMTEEEICRAGRNGLVNLNDPNLPRLLEERERIGKTHGELTFIRKDGSIIPTEISSSIYTNRKGEVRSSLIIRDISERKAYEEKLKNSERIFEHSTDMMAISGFDGFFKVVNPAFEKTLGWSQKELLSHPWIHFVHSEDHENTRMVKNEIIHGRAAYRFENRYRCKDGVFKWLSWNAFPYSEEDIMFAVARDITKSKQDEEELRKLKDNLQEEVNQKTMELNKRIDELERFQQATIEREFRIKELRNEIEQLRGKNS